ncbi:hypothetical protein FQN57_005127 [Myotisia sp. PD_48]|nr:hypothetical protein FQN57_005127 [Myotisia sp. PD_48]
MSQRLQRASRGNTEIDEQARTQTRSAGTQPNATGQEGLLNDIDGREQAVGKHRGVRRTVSTEHCLRESEGGERDDERERETASCPPKDPKKGTPEVVLTPPNRFGPRVSHRPWMHAQIQCMLRSARCGRIPVLRRLDKSRYNPLQYKAICKFHSSRHFRTSDSPHGPADSSINSAKPNPAPELESDHPNLPETSSATKNPILTKEFSPYGSAVRRAMRSRKPVEPRPVLIADLPKWFQERNLRLSDQSIQVMDPRRLGVGIDIDSKAVEEESQKKEAQGGGDDGGNNGRPEEDPSSASEFRYTLSSEVWNELRAAVQAGLELPSSMYDHDPATGKPHLVFHYPGDGGTLFLDAVVTSLAKDLNANVATLNAQDIAELYSQQRHGNKPPTNPSILLLGYDVYQPRKRASQKEVEEESEETDDQEVEEDESDHWPSRSGSPPVARITADMSGLFNPSPLLQSLFGGKASFGIAKVMIPNGSASKDDFESGTSDDVDLRCLRLIHKLIDVPIGRRVPPANDQSNDQSQEQPKEESKDEAKPESEEDSKNEQKVESSIESQDRKPTLIIQVQDYKDIMSSEAGRFFLGLLHRTVMRRRRNGDQVMIVGTVSEPESDRGAGVGKTFPKLIPKDYDPRMSTIMVTPTISSKVAEALFSEDAKKRILEINTRHLKSMLKARLRESGASGQTILSLDDQPWELDTSLVRTTGLDLGYWPFDLVHRVATVALGCAKSDENLKLEHITQAIELVGRSDQIKCDWLGDKYTKAKPSRTATEIEKDRRNKLRGKCNSHEEKLLNGVVDPESITTTFDDVHVPPETVEALKTLTTLSLIRPEAFTYGVLSTDKIPGLLLYGPPGTGKTLLAKAVARESGATVLEVSGSDVYDMYVGEGEKNVKAIFTLAKKLSPCVVFIDEADAIFCSRTGSSNRTSHRELINQFLREWDGMNSLSAFIMIATNRPFDLDDAVLRRLPRRLLVDLPTEKDREAILKIHLKEEKLDESVDIADIANRTPFYSGSDLKNLAVAAALSCVREENDMAAQHKGEEPYKYPEHRVLRRPHFERAMEEISASISEDMSSLTAIRKFDEKFGDRKGRKKKTMGWGFTAPGLEPRVSDEAGRVRN